MFYKGLIGVDWEDGVDFGKMREERMEKANASMKMSGVLSNFSGGGGKK